MKRDQLAAFVEALEQRWTALSKHLLSTGQLVIVHTGTGKPLTMSEIQTVPMSEWTSLSVQGSQPGLAALSDGFRFTKWKHANKHAWEPRPSYDPFADVVSDEKRAELYQEAKAYEGLLVAHEKAAGLSPPAAAASSQGAGLALLALVAGVVGIAIFAKSR